MRLDRRTAMAALMKDRADDLLVVPGLGSTTWDLAATGDDPRNFYLWGAMGGAAMIGLGLALAQPTRRIAVITGDGEMLMGLGALATIGIQRPSNLAIIVFDNGVYGETGMQPSHTQSGVDLIGVARACGIAHMPRRARRGRIDQPCTPIERSARDPFCTGADQCRRAAARAADARRRRDQGPVPRGRRHQGMTVGAAFWTVRTRASITPAPC